MPSDDLKAMSEWELLHRCAIAMGVGLLMPQGSATRLFLLYASEEYLAEVRGRAAVIYARAISQN